MYLTRSRFLCNNSKFEYEEQLTQMKIPAAVVDYSASREIIEILSYRVALKLLHLFRGQTDLIFEDGNYLVVDKRLEAVMDSLDL